MDSGKGVQGAVAYCTLFVHALVVGVVVGHIVGRPPAASLELVLIAVLLECSCMGWVYPHQVLPAFPRSGWLRAVEEVGHAVPQANQF